MNGKKIGAIVLAVVVVALIVFFAIWLRNASGPQGTNGNEAATVQPTSPTRALAPSDVVVPDKGQENSPNVATPVIQGPASPTSAAQFRSFSLSVKNGTYVPDIIAVNRGDIVDLEITAVDGSYGFAQPDYGFNVSIPKGATKRIQFSANMAGKFTFYCAACGGPGKGPVGYVIVKQ